MAPTGRRHGRLPQQGVGAPYKSMDASCSQQAGGCGPTLSCLCNLLYQRVFLSEFWLLI